VDFSVDDDHLAIAAAVDRVCADFDDSYWAEDRLTETFLLRAAVGELHIAFGSPSPTPAPTRRASAPG